jgi:hypothetical protein
MNTRNLGHKLLAVYLILVGALQLFGIHLGVLSPIVPVLAIAAGVCLLLGK